MTNYKGFDVPAGSDPANVPQSFRNLVDSFGTQFASTSAADAVGIPAYVVVNINGALQYKDSSGAWTRVDLPPAMVMAYPLAAAPPGWLLCDGTSYLKSAYPALATAIGTTYGGDATRFNVPNLKGKVPVGRDTSQGEFDTIAETGGAKTRSITLSQSNIPAHSHTMNHDHPSFSTLDNTFGSSGGAGLQGGAGWTASVGAITIDVPNYTGSTGTAGSTVPFDVPTLQPYIVMNYVIKT